MVSKLSVGKIVATSTSSAWSQAYHAGGFTAVVSLTSSTDEGIEESLLHKTGKDILDTLIAEYFTLTTKDLDTVRGAVETTAAKVPEGFHLSMVVGATVKNILYLVVVNNGKVLLKRGEKTGTLIQLDRDNRQIESVSGYLEAGDTVILQTEQFEEIFPEHELVSSLDHHNPLELAEMLAPKVHESQNGGASALIFSYHEEEPSPLETSTMHSQVQEKEEKTKAPEFFPKESLQKEPESVSGSEEKEKEYQAPFSPSQRKGFRFSHTQKLFLTIAVILAGVLMTSIILFVNRQKQAQQEQLFQSIYTPAKAKYDEGQSLADLNKSLALSDFQAAKDLLSGAVGKFPSDSSQEKQITNLLNNVNNSLNQTTQANIASTAIAPDNASPLLTFQAKQTTPYVTQDDTNFYSADNSVVSTTSKKTSATKQVIKNSSDYQQIGGLAAYLGNLYILDKQDGIIKYVPAGSSYGKSTYLAAGVKPDFSKAVSMTIDGSIWVLSSDGTVSEYLRGKQVSLTLSGLDKPFANPSSIITSADDSNVYVLDNGNSRLVVLDKTGKYLSQYQSGNLKNATGLDLDEKNKKAYFLNAGKVYQLSLQ